METRSSPIHREIELNSSNGNDATSNLDLDHQSTKVDSSNNHVDNSLVFGNDISKEEQDNLKQDDMRARNEDNSLFELQNNPIDTPFLDKLRDPFDDSTGNGTKSNEISPVRPKSMGGIYSQLRGETEDSWLPAFDMADTQKIDNQPGLDDDTQKIDHKPQGLFEDTQKIDIKPQGLFEDFHKLHSDPQKVYQETQLIERVIPMVEAETQAIDSETQIIQAPLNDDTQVIKVSSQFNADTQVIKASSQFNADTQIIGTDPQLEDDTQVIRSSSQDAKGLTEDTNNLTSPPTTQLDFTHIHTGHTLDRMMSHRQVLNTQEEKELSFSLEKSNHEDDLEEVRTDDEKDVDISTDYQYEDSLLTHKLSKKRKMKTFDPSPHKMSKLSEPSQKPSLPPNSVPLVFASPIEIGESSPVVKKSDFLRLPSRSSPSKVISQSQNAGVQIANLPSSPQKTNTMYEELSSEIEDIDLDEETKSSEQDSKVSKIIPARRKKQYIVETQSQPDDFTDIHSVESKTKENHTENGIFTKEYLEILTEENIQHKDSVWAIFNLKMYPGTIIDQGQEQMTVKFSDGLFDIKNSDLFVLDIRVGDIIRIRSSTQKFIVVGLGNSDSNSPIKCMRGYNLVYVKKLSTKATNSPDICFPLAECFMELEDWVQHQQTFGLIYNQQDILKQDVYKKNNISEMVLSVATTQLATPNILKQEHNGLFSSPNASNRTSPRKLLQHDNTGKVFSRKLFCITSIEGERKDKIKRLIEGNGGVLVNEGLNELFEFSTSTTDNLVLKSHLLGEFTFGAIISNNHCRSAKYLQALALGWPILSDTFIVHCVRDRSKVDHWPSYLLPAGHSTKMNSLRSLDVFQFRNNCESDRTLNEQACNNVHLLEKYDVFVLTNKRNDHTLETCRFIFYSFGAKSLTYCTTYNEILERIRALGKDSDRDILVYEDGDVVRKKLVALQLKRVETSRTRTRSQQSKVAQQLYATSNNLISIGVIDWEYVVQCVISGYIWDNKTYEININHFD